jgi:hypothetical protein
VAGTNIQRRIGSGVVNAARTARTGAATICCDVGTTDAGVLMPHFLRQPVLHDGPLEPEAILHHAPIVAPWPAGVRHEPRAARRDGAVPPHAAVFDHQLQVLEAVLDGSVLLAAGVHAAVARHRRAAVDRHLPVHHAGAANVEGHPPDVLGPEGAGVEVHRLGRGEVGRDVLHRVRHPRRRSRRPHLSDGAPVPANRYFEIE